MVELVIVSGKGGTGKTSLAGSFAALARNKVLVDCDVDAADLHLILRNQIKESTEFIAGSRASIIDEKCTACAVCLDYCRFDSIRHKADKSNPNGERFWIDQLSCEGCGVCAHFCPEDAISFKETVSGEWFLSDTPHGPLVHARLGIAQGNSGKLVSILRNYARTLAAEKGLELILIDGPPGIGCPVIASVTGADYILIVTEPSLSAIHDMERLLDLANHFRIPVAICVNKYDINPKLTSRIEDFAREKGIKILGKITYDPIIVKAQVAGTTLIEHSDNGTCTQVRSLWANIENELKAARENKVQSKIS